jgi:hypothetical protein
LQKDAPTNRILNVVEWPLAVVAGYAMAVIANIAMFRLCGLDTCYLASRSSRKQLTFSLPLSTSAATLSYYDDMFTGWRRLDRTADDGIS